MRGSIYHEGVQNTITKIQPRGQYIMKIDPRVKISYDTGYRLISPAIAIKSPTIIFPSIGLMLKKKY
jgi:hypothetical protein